MATVSVRYIVDQVDPAIAFYRDHLGFHVQMHPAPTFAMLTRGDLRLVLSAPGGGPGGGQAMPDGAVPQPGGWNRFSVEVDDLEGIVLKLRKAGAHFRNDVVDGVGGRQILLDDPSGNPVELFEPTRSEARLEDLDNAAQRRSVYEVRPIGWIESSLGEPADAPNQGGEGAPDAWLVMADNVREAIRDLQPDTEIIVLTWLHRARRDELTCYPGDDPTSRELGVFSTRSPERPNPIGMHRVPIVAIENTRIHVRSLEAVNGTPIVDIKPVLDPHER